MDATVRCRQNPPSVGLTQRLNFFVVDVTQIGAVRGVRDEYVNTSQPPASTLIEVSRLFRDDVLIEVDAVAVRD